MDSIISGIIAGVTSGAVISTIVGFLLHKRTAAIEATINAQFERSMTIFRSTREWKEQSLSELLGPMYMQLDRTKRAFDRWTGQNLFLEAKVIGEANKTIRDLLLNKGHLIPPNLLNDAGLLVEHYDRWLEEFEKKRLAENPDLKTPFTFVGPAGFPFPTDSERRFKEAFQSLWNELYGAR